MQLRSLRNHWNKKYRNHMGVLRRADVECYIRSAEDYLATVDKRRQCTSLHYGLCWFSKNSAQNFSLNSYCVWDAMSKVRGSVAHKWQASDAARQAGATIQRVTMVKSLIKELKQMVEKDKRKR